MKIDADDPEFADFAAKVSNDVSENIDCRETRAQLREVIRWWASHAGMESVNRASAESDLRVLRALVSDMMPYVRKARGPRANALCAVADVYIKRWNQAPRKA
jgi:hypothetical protein